MGQRVAQQPWVGKYTAKNNKKGGTHQPFLRVSQPYLRERGAGVGVGRRWGGGGRGGLLSWFRYRETYVSFDQRRETIMKFVWNKKKEKMAILEPKNDEINKEWQM